MSGREQILARVRAACEHRREHPGAFRPPARPATWQAFASALERLGAAARGPLERAEVGAAVRSLASGRIVAEVDALDLLGEGPWQSLESSAEARDLDGVGVGVLLGSFAVAENGAVAIGRASARERALLLLCERLVLLVDVAEVVSDMHEAAARLERESLRGSHFSWVAGPSKTADIEQTLVVGAHGPRALAVLGYRNPSRNTRAGGSRRSHTSRSAARERRT